MSPTDTKKIINSPNTKKIQRIKITKFYKFFLNVQICKIYQQCLQS